MKPLSIQPIPYQGSKRSLAPRICQLLPKGIETLYEPFAGSAAITIYAATHNLAERFVIGDSFDVLIDLWEMIIERPSEISERYSEVWHGNLITPITLMKCVRPITRQPTLFSFYTWLPDV